MSNELLRTRIGNTVTVVLPVLTRGDAVSLVGRDITIMLVDPNDVKTPVSFTVGGVSNNIATFVVEGTSQTATGTYRAEVYENYRGTAMAVYDCDIFVLVARTEYENDGNEGVSSETTTLDPINIAWVGRDGYTPYIENGFWYINGTSTGVRALGENGDTPYIHEGYWYINGTSTGIKADYATEEAARAAAEIVRMNAELARAQAEQTRKDAEVSRSTNESGRSAAEGVRILAESDRQSEEAMRQTNEEIRTDNEEARVEAELGRAASEASRAQVEATRVANETARTTAEATRAANEQTRVSEESDRAAAETARIAAETARETAEDGRTSAEATRVSNEQTRVSNESTRQSNESARQSAETARQAAYVAAEDARDAAFAAKEATRDAANEAALNCAESLAALGPKIGEPQVIQVTESDKYITLSGGVGNEVNMTPSTSSSGFCYSIVEVSEGDKLIVNGVGGNSARLWGFVDSNNVLLSVASASASATNLELVTPENAVKAIINDNSGSTSYIFYSSEKTVVLTSDIVNSPSEGGSDKPISAEVVKILSEKTDAVEVDVKGGSFVLEITELQGKYYYTNGQTINNDNSLYAEVSLADYAGDSVTITLTNKYPGFSAATGIYVNNGFVNYFREYEYTQPITWEIPQNASLRLSHYKTSSLTITITTIGKVSKITGEVGTLKQISTPSIDNVPAESIRYNNKSIPSLEYVNPLPFQRIATLDDISSLESLKNHIFINRRMIRLSIPNVNNEPLVIESDVDVIGCDKIIVTTEFNIV